ncbi:MAG: hypothetical protein MUC92_11440 [Fimbriimonadaceae bacterium]|nr:hypothetical protein [Fimbriimonadaceae bacterium]
MKQIIFRLLGVASVALVALPVLAQQRDQFDYDIAELRILQLRPVQDELKVTTNQRAKLTTHASWFNGELQKLDKQFAETRKSNPRAQPPLSAVQNLERQLKQRCFNELNATQLRRLREITLQQAGPLAVLDPRVARRIGITDATRQDMERRFQAQQQRVRKIADDALAPLNRKYGNTQPKDQAEAQRRQSEAQAALAKVQPQVAKIEQEFMAFMDRTLTAEQKAAYQRLLGAAFRMPQQGQGLTQPMPRSGGR